MMEYKLKELNVADIKPDKNQPRKTFDEEELQHLAESILSNGLLNPIEVDENYVITDGERRWKAHKIAKIKTITCRIVKNKDKTEKLRRQLIFTLQDEEIPTEDKYPAITNLYNLDIRQDPTITKELFSKKLGISPTTLKQALEYSNFVEKEPEIAKKVAPHIIIETASLPKEERKEVLKEFEGTKDKKKDLIREMVKDKKEQIQTKKLLIELKKKVEENKEAKKWEVKVTTTKEVLSDIRDDIYRTNDQLNKMIFNIKRIRRTKFYSYNAREKEVFFRVIDGAIDRVEKWGKELRQFKEDFQLEVVKE